MLPLSQTSVMRSFAQVMPETSAASMCPTVQPSGEKLFYSNVGGCWHNREAQVQKMSSTNTVCLPSLCLPAPNSSHQLISSADPITASLEYLLNSCSFTAARPHHSSV